FLDTGVDSRSAAHLRVRAVGGDDEPRRQALAPARAQRERDALRSNLDRLDSGRDPPLDLRDLAEPVPERATDDAIRRDIPECLDTLLARIEAGEAEAARIGDMDRADG